MSHLHVHFALRNQQAFQRALGGQAGAAGAPTPSTSGGKGSLSRPSHLGAIMAADINARDWLGRTVLHLAVAEPAALEYVRLVLAHPAVNVNLQDTESHWTALHRALYNGNIAAALLLVQRADTDLSLKDFEGYTAFDLYNSTVEHTKPTPLGKGGAELFTWGANRNATLGVGSADDRVYPEQIVLRHADDSYAPDAPLDARFAPIRFRQVDMSKLHTGVVTTERSVNVRLCGFGSGGRLGLGQHTQYQLCPLAQFQQNIASLALGQDHTLALTRSGEVYSWGLNRFSQLGYVVEAATGTSGGPGTGAVKTEEAIQSIPKRILGSLRKETVLGVAACKTASACWTDRELFTWGTNAGQLGYDRAAQPVQALPRIVTKITQPVIGVALSDSALACLLSSREVICLWNDRHIRINFPTQTWPSEITPYRPPQTTEITKVTTCDGAFAALSSQGEVFTFAPPSPASVDALSAAKGPLIKPQRVWALRKKFSAVRDVALGAEGSLVVCTESGHVYVRSRAPKATSGQKTFKFQRMPFIQRVAAVCANSTGAFGALRTEYRSPPITIIGRTVAEDIAEVQPYMVLPLDQGQEVQSIFRRRNAVTSPVGPAPLLGDHDGDGEEEGEDTPVAKDITALRKLFEILRLDNALRSTTNGHGVFQGAKQSYGSDLIVRIGAFEFPAHRVLAAARCTALEDVLARSKTIKEDKATIQSKRAPTSGSTILLFTGFQPMTVLILFVYLYSDDIPALWDRRVMLALEPQLAASGVRPMQVKTEMLAAARMLGLPLLRAAAEPHVKRAPVPSMVRNLHNLYERTQKDGASLLHGPLAPDVVLQLADREVPCHSVALRARSPFFAAFLGDTDWTRARWTKDGTVAVDMKHLRWRSMQYVLRFLSCGEDREMFESLNFISSVEELLDFMFEVKAAANELHLERLILICSEVIIRYVNVQNVSSLLGDASHLHSSALVSSLQSYMAVNIETLLESRFLEELTPDLVKQLSKFVQQRQGEKSPVTRGNVLVEKAMARFGGWLELQDIPTPIAPSQKVGPARESPRLSPPTPFKKRRASGPTSPVARPQIAPQPIVATASNDDIFVMDEVVPPLVLEPPSALRAPDVAPKTMGTWKSVSAAPKTDMKSIMEEAAGSKGAPARVPPAPKTPQREWRKVPLSSPEASKVAPTAPRTPSAISIQRTPSGGSPWRLPGTPFAMDPSSSPPTDVLGMPRAGISRVRSNLNMSADATSSSPPTPSRVPPPIPSRFVHAQHPGLGPIISPLRQPSGTKVDAPITRRVSSTSGKAWTLPPVQPVVRPSQAATTPLSFTDIQALQIEQKLPPVKDTRSLKEIQEEEQARQVEDDFMKWWQEEEERVRLEAIPDILPSVPPKKGKRTKGTKTTGSTSGNTSNVPTQAAASSTASVTIPSGSSSTGRAPEAKGARRGGHRPFDQSRVIPPSDTSGPVAPSSTPPSHQASRRGGRGSRGSHRGGRGGHNLPGNGPLTPQPLSQAT